MSHDAVIDAPPTPGSLPDGASEAHHALPATALLAAIIDCSDDAIVSKTLSGRILSWNGGATRIFGYSAAEVIGQPITIIIPPELHEEERRILERLSHGERIEHFDTTRLTKDGRRIPISLTVSPIRDARGVVIGASKVARDISERKRSESRLLESEQRLTAEAEALRKLNDLSAQLWRCGSLAEGLEQMLTAALELLAGQQGTVQFVERSSGRLALAAQHGFAQAFLEVFREAASSPASACGRSLRSGERVVIEDVHSDAAYAPYREAARAAGYRAVTASPLLSLGGTLLGVVTVHFPAVHRPSAQELRRLDLYLRQASDFIDRCRLEQLARDSAESLREADRRKDEFLAVLAHELRNPLAPIRYALATARQSGRTPEQQQLAQTMIERQVSHMTRLLDDLLDISRITHGTLELKKTRAELAAVITGAVETARPVLDSRQHQLTLDLPPQSVWLEADAVRLAQVFSNLLINAAKYTAPGGRIGLRATRSEHELVVVVSDNGPGIPAALLPRLFTLFPQRQSLPGHPESGLGVGLALVRTLVALHGGTVSARSAGPGAGSEFTVRLPLGTPTAGARGSAQLPASALPAAGAALKILVVDDNHDSADACAMLLELSGHEVRTAYTARGALELAQSFRPQVFLLDIGLPDLDGYQLAREIRASHWAQGAVLVAVSGWGRQKDRRRALGAGFDHHLTKPTSPESLAALLQSVARAPAPPLAGRA